MSPDGLTETMVWMEPVPVAGKVEHGISVTDATGVMSLPMYTLPPCKLVISTVYGLGLSQEVLESSTTVKPSSKLMPLTFAGSALHVMSVYTGVNLE
eukprot:CAMPEP_0177508436 /NCGR_PEP_ID=MMETSP0369-20130122/41027_1 /TAXON_ID=447022 ORGANISM="Scrippsiella hangoei-like, Strain SHHI-4" /NCGR_SAMPLE_ID=MMETSP0369 /ASSEMBLY_ACC=CAM_ASM_000364 /LENGTH=96 /DNA_ID=CAMNT_0018986549 /DNA_START=812 /DNA_END=1102 /DNA_ORIENTATION=+